jgi:hypothetical protein
VPWYYGVFKDKETGRKIRGSKFVKWPKPNESYFNEELYKAVKNKTKPLAIMASNCKAISRRLEMIKRLRNYIPVDIYGGCGNLK